jgi:hypothetical protein
MRRAGRPVAAFQSAFDAFCARYGLSGLADWYLPLAASTNVSGIPLPAPTGVPTVQIQVPVQFGLMAKDNLTSVLRRQQELALRAAQLDPGLVHPRTATTDGHLLEFNHYWPVAEARYGQPPRPRGFVERLKEGFADYLKKDDQHIRILYRKWRAAVRPTCHRPTSS